MSFYRKREGMSSVEDRILMHISHYGKWQGRSGVLLRSIALLENGKPLADASMFNMHVMILGVQYKIWGE